MKTQSSFANIMKPILAFAILFTFLTVFSSCKKDEENGLLETWMQTALFSVNLVDQGNGTVLDAGSGRIWMKCSQGQVWDGALNLCTGAGTPNVYGAKSMAFCTIDSGCINLATLQANSGPAFTSCNNLVFAGASNWRLPTKIELQTLAAGIQNRSTLDTIFPQTPLDTKYYWTGEQSTSAASDAYGVSFIDGSFSQVLEFNKVSASLYVRCIR